MIAALPPLPAWGTRISTDGPFVDVASDEIGNPVEIESEVLDAKEHLSTHLRLTEELNDDRTVTRSPTLVELRCGVTVAMAPLQAGVLRDNLTAALALVGFSTPPADQPLPSPASAITGAADEQYADRITALLGDDPEKMLDDDAMMDLIDQGRADGASITADALMKVLAITAEHGAWRDVEEYAAYQRDVAFRLGYAAARARLAGRPILRWNYISPVDAVNERWAQDRVAAEQHAREYAAKFGELPRASQRRDAGCEKWCLAEHLDQTDPLLAGTGYHHRGEVTKIPLADGPGRDRDGEIQVGLARWQPSPEDPDPTTEVVVEIAGGDNTGSEGLTVLSLDEAERLGQMLLNLVERSLNDPARLDSAPKVPVASR